jgi:hypothetical protein
MIADLVGRKNTTVTEPGLPHQLKPVIAEGSAVMNTIFKQSKEAQATAKSA